VEYDTLPEGLPLAFNDKNVKRLPMKQHLLVVDDEAPIRDLLSEYLRKHGFEVTAAATADEAIRLSNEASVNLMILDIGLPDADGLELLEIIKTSHPNLPVIMLTGMGFDDELLQEALRKKASGYLSKTLPLDQLLIQVRRTLKG
jgi:DNA-binding NtrC family response regulator